MTSCDVGENAGKLGAVFERARDDLVVDGSRGGGVLQLLAFLGDDVAIHAASCRTFWGCDVDLLTEFAHLDFEALAREVPGIRGACLVEQDRVAPGDVCPDDVGVA